MLNVVRLRYSEARGETVLEDAFTLSTGENSIIIRPGVAIELYFAKGKSLALGQSPGMKPFELYRTLYLEDAAGNSKAASDLYMPMEASF